MIAETKSFHFTATSIPTNGVSSKVMLAIPKEQINVQTQFLETQILDETQSPVHSIYSESENEEPVPPAAIEVSNESNHSRVALCISDNHPSQWLSTKPSSDTHDTILHDNESSSVIKKRKIDLVENKVADDMEIASSPPPKTKQQMADFVHELVSEGVKPHVYYSNNALISESPILATRNRMNKSLREPVVMATPSPAAPKRPNVQRPSLSKKLKSIDGDDKYMFF